MSTKAQRRAERRRAVTQSLVVRRPWCEIRWEGCTLRATDPHEPRMRSRTGQGSRQGDLIMDETQIVMGCRNCHDKVHANPARAEAAGLLIPSGPVPKVPTQEPANAGQ